MAAPLYERLKRYAIKNRIPFAMPGHKNGRGLSSNLLSLDVTELNETENLYHGGEYVKEANRLLSELYGSDESFILTGGSTAAIQAMICGAVKRGGTLLADGGCHRSVINACALLGINIRFFPKETDSDFCVPKGTAAIKEYLTDNVDAVIVTSPNYYGICSDIKNIARECHAKNIPLLVDEAHGAHFIAADALPETAVHFADAVCHSAHKTLSAMNGAAYLHLSGNLIDKKRAKKALTMFVSTSPSYVIASSADSAREEIEDGGGWEKTIDMCEYWRRKIFFAGMNVLENDDRTRLVINFSQYDITGFEVSRRLSEKGIDIEMADLFNIVLIVTPLNTEKDFTGLFAALEDIVSHTPLRARNIKILPPPAAHETLSPSETFWSEQEEIELEKAAGRISCAAVVPYPPGVPVIFTGEKIREEQIEYIKHITLSGGEVNGIENGKICVIK